ncbi:hypothetical protein V8J88_15430 [Massilia sp. W12]|uniref:hypothetical protein n=1 Tax=Massilia sp. W12 TaxID=3126507 RepID=UPI0030D17D68
MTHSTQHSLIELAAHELQHVSGGAYFWDDRALTSSGSGSTDTPGNTLIPLPR